MQFNNLAFWPGCALICTYSFLSHRCDLSKCKEPYLRPNIVRLFYIHTAHKKIMFPSAHRYVLRYSVIDAV